MSKLLNVDSIYIPIDFHRQIEMFQIIFYDSSLRKIKGFIVKAMLHLAECVYFYLFMSNIYRQLT